MSSSAWPAPLGSRVSVSRARPGRALRRPAPLSSLTLAPGSALRLAGLVRRQQRLRDAHEWRELWAAEPVSSQIGTGQARLRHKELPRCG